MLQNGIAFYYSEHDISIISFPNTKTDEMEMIFEILKKEFLDIEVIIMSGRICIYWEGEKNRFLTNDLPTKVGDNYIVGESLFEVVRFQVYDENWKLLASSDNLNDLNYSLSSIYVRDKTGYEIQLIKTQFQQI